MPPRAPPSTVTVVWDTIIGMFLGSFLAVLRLFTPNPAEPRILAGTPWLYLNQIVEMSGLKKRAVVRALRRVSSRSDYVTRFASDAEVRYLLQSGLMPPSAHEATLVTVSHVIDALRLRVSPELLELLESLATRPLSPTQLQPGTVRTIRDKASRRVTLMPVDANAPLVLPHSVVKLTGGYCLTAAEIKANPVLANQLQGLDFFNVSVRNLRRATKAMSAKSVSNLLNTAKAYLGYYAKAWPYTQPSLMVYLDGATFYSFLEYLEHRGEARVRTAGASAPGTQSQVGRCVGAACATGIFFVENVKLSG